MTTKIYNIESIAASICEEQNKHLLRKKPLSFYTDNVTKYYNTVCDAVYAGVYLARGDQLEGEWIPVSFTAMREKFPARLTLKDGSKVYWYKYLQEHYPLLTVHKQGYKNNNKGEYAMVTPTIDIEVLLAGKVTKDLIDHLYPDQSILQDRTQCDWVPVDLVSLANYIKSNNAIQQRNPKLNNNLQVARVVYDVAEYFDGKFPQVIKESVFGRKYYKGVNLQSSPKIVREAALGQCHAYDISASVFAWKFFMGKSLDPELKLPATIDYLDFKSLQRKRLTQVVYGNTEDYNVKRIKSAFAAIGFGAKAQNGVWYTDGKMQQAALNNALGHTDAVERFLADSWVQEFIAEQKTISGLLFEWFKANVLETIKEKVKGDAKAITEARAVAFMYQKAERALIEKAMQLAADDEVLLLVHDGFYTRRSSRKQDVKEVIANEFAVEGYPMPACDHEEVRPYSFVDFGEVNSHKEFMRQEGKRAEAYAMIQGRTTHSISQDQILAREKKREAYIKQQRKSYSSSGFFNGTYNPDDSYKTNDEDGMPEDVLNVLSRN